MKAKYDTNNESVKRILKEYRELVSSPSSEFCATPMPTNIFEWHFTIKGASETDYSGGVYHGRLSLPPNYPFKPPDIYFLTPNGRFRTHTKICLSMSSYHPETWQCSWRNNNLFNNYSIRTILLALVSFLPSPAEGVGSISCHSSEKKRLALTSHKWKCESCEFNNLEIMRQHLDKLNKLPPSSDNTSLPEINLDHVIFSVESSSDSSKLSTVTSSLSWFNIILLIFSFLIFILIIFKKIVVLLIDID